MTYRIVCPVQDAQAFTVDACLRCKYLNLHRGEHISVSCRKQRTPQHKRDFEGAYLSWYIGLNDTVIVEKEGDHGGQ